ncbi:EAL domain-containing protein [Primorskyibacter sp. S187A]|uniref:putative bifunctional diguanylate cyclase/phosphodiesterase n=1 Tax=Primorskyibacter sp. S187A TaxID=3415130 RepID=UPI003C7CCBDD
MVPANIIEQIKDKSIEGLALGRADPDDGAIFIFQWCNAAFTKVTGYDASDIIGERGSLLIGEQMAQGQHLIMIEKLMNWEHFSVTVLNNRKNGDLMWQQITWTPLTDTETGDRWWLCSLIEVTDVQQKAPKDPTARPDASDGQDHSRWDVFAQKIRHLEKENKRLRDLARVVSRESQEDYLTGISNRRHFEVELQSWTARLRQNGKEFAVFYIDLDDFKLINDTLGHQAGDQLLTQFAQALRDLAEPEDFVARLGGDEFVIFKRLSESALDVSKLADDIVRKTQGPYLLGDRNVMCSTSVGVAMATRSTEHPERVVADADSALYHAKSQGKKRWSYFTEDMHAASLATRRLAGDLRNACETRAFVPYFQPLIDVETGKMYSAEVLVRWPHPELGLLAPDTFLATAANLGFVKTIDEIVFGHLRDTLDVFDASGVDLPRIGINVSTARLADPTFIHDIKSSGIDPKRLIVEILETVSLERMSDVVRWAVSELNELGVTIAVDDFGTGHASVQGLLQIQPSVLKIDRQFIDPILESETSRKLAASMVGIGKSLGLRIVAEGIKTEAQARAAADMGCDYLQGFLFGAPMDATELHDKLAANAGHFWAAHVH